MRPRNIVQSIIPPLVLILMSGCDAPQYLSANTPDGNVVGFERYTSRAKASPRSEVFALVVADTFSPSERAQIARAVNQWNVILKGFIRFEIMAEDAGASSEADERWVINSNQSFHGEPSNALAVTRSHPAIRGGELTFTSDVSAHATWAAWCCTSWAMLWAWSIATSGG